MPGYAQRAQSVFATGEIRVDLLSAQRLYRYGSMQSDTCRLSQVIGAAATHNQGKQAMLLPKSVDGFDTSDTRRSCYFIKAIEQRQNLVGRDKCQSQLSRHLI